MSTKASLLSCALPFVLFRLIYTASRCLHGMLLLSVRVCLLMCNIQTGVWADDQYPFLLSSACCATYQSEGHCADMQGPIANLNEHLASPFVNNGFANATKCVPLPLCISSQSSRGSLRADVMSVSGHACCHACKSVLPILV